ncbi:serpentine type 7TM GPCR chemoreceptor srx domain-containing protein [Ditylenchus destructor]|nr:serpentine type 7TM GPCR chemoreceptor srx domain-containing protein [Ditylenchus destructor]
MEDPATKTTRFIGASCYVIMCLISSTLNLLLLSIFIKSHQRFKSISFFILAWQLLICDMLGVFVQFVLAIPQTFAGYSLYSPIFSHVIGSFDTISFNGSIMFALLLTINRLCIFMFPTVDRMVFGTPTIYGVIGLGWILVLIFFTGLTATGCYKGFNVKGFHLQSENCNQNPSLVAYIFQRIRDYWALYPIYVMLGIYALITVRLKFANGFQCGKIMRVNNGGQIVRDNKREIVFFIQIFRASSYASPFLSRAFCTVLFLRLQLMANGATL